MKKITIGVPEATAKFLEPHLGSPHESISDVIVAMLHEHMSLLAKTWDSLNVFTPDHVNAMVDALDGYWHSDFSKKDSFYRHMCLYYKSMYAEKARKIPKDVRRFLRQLRELSCFEEYALLLLIELLWVSNIPVYVGAHQYLDIS